MLSKKSWKNEAGSCGNFSNVGNNFFKNVDGINNGKLPQNRTTNEQSLHQPSAKLLDSNMATKQLENQKNWKRNREFGNMETSCSLLSNNGNKESNRFLQNTNNAVCQTSTASNSGYTIDKHNKYLNIDNAYEKNEKNKYFINNKNKTQTNNIFEKNKKIKTNWKQVFESYKKKVDISFFILGEYDPWRNMHKNDYLTFQKSAEEQSNVTLNNNKNTLKFFQENKSNGRFYLNLNNEVVQNTSNFVISFWPKLKEKITEDSLINLLDHNEICEVITTMFWKLNDISSIIVLLKGENKLESLYAEDLFTAFVVNLKLLNIVESNIYMFELTKQIKTHLLKSTEFVNIHKPMLVNVIKHKMSCFSKYDVCRNVFEKVQEKTDVLVHSCDITYNDIYAPESGLPFIMFFKTYHSINVCKKLAKVYDYIKYIEQLPSKYDIFPFSLIRLQTVCVCDKDSVDAFFNTVLKTFELNIETTNDVFETHTQRVEIKQTSIKIK